MRRLLVLLAVVILLVARSSGAPRPSDAAKPHPDPGSLLPTIAHVHAQAADLSAQNGPGLTINSTRLPLVVDGQQHPESVPDRVAYDHFISANALPTGDLATSATRADRKLARLGLAPHDHEALIRSLTGVKERLSAIDAARRQPSPDRAAIRAQEQAVLSEVRNSIAAALSAGGAQRLEAFIHADVKRRIKIYGAIPQ